MRGLFVLTDDSQSIEEAENYAGEELVVLVVMDRNALATSFEDELRDVEKRAQEVKQRMKRKNIPCRVLLEWGDRVESVSNALQREKAELVNKASF